MSWQLVESDEVLRDVLARARRHDAVIVDTEFMRRNTFHPQVALVQLAFEQDSGEVAAWLIDPLAIDNPSPLAELLADPGIIKVLHSPSEDLEVFQHWLGVLPRPLFDTQRAAALLDLGFGLGYRTLVHELTSVDLPKGETTSNWLQRPLTRSQCDYAAQDVTHLLGVWQLLAARCRESDRFDWVLADGEDALASAGTAGRDYHLRIKSAWNLDRRQLATLIAICEWRERTARTRDKPRSWIIDDKTCLELARRSPRSRIELRALEMPSPVIRRHGDELLALLEAQREVPDSVLPPRLPAPLAPAQRTALKSLKASAREIAVGLALAPEILLAGKDFELLLREHAGETINVPPSWQGWRGDAVIAPLRRKLGEGGR